MKNGFRIRWELYQKIHDLAGESVCRGEENQLSDAEVAEANTALLAAHHEIVKVAALIIKARQKWKSGVTKAVASDLVRTDDEPKPWGYSD